MSSRHVAVNCGGAALAPNFVEQLGSRIDMGAFATTSNSLVPRIVINATTTNSLKQSKSPRWPRGLGSTVGSYTPQIGLLLAVERLN